MPAKSKQKKSEDMLLRLIRVAEILAECKDAALTIPENNRKVESIGTAEHTSATQ